MLSFENLVRLDKKQMREKEVDQKKSHPVASPNNNSCGAGPCILILEGVGKSKEEGGGGSCLANFWFLPH